MRAYYLIYKTLYSKQQIVKSLLHFIALFIIIFYILDNFYGMYSNYVFFTGPYRYGKFDAIVYDSTEKDFESQFTKENIAEIIPLSTSLLDCKFLYGSNEYFDELSPSTTCNIAGYYGTSLEPVTDTVLSGCTIKKNDKLLAADDAILLSDAIAMRIKADVGDTVALKCYTSVTETEEEGFFKYHFDSDQEYRFKIAAVYQTNMISARAVLKISALKEIVTESYPERENQENVFQSFFQTYVTFYDIEKGIPELERYIPTDTMVFQKYGEDWKEHIGDFYKNDMTYDDYASSVLQSGNDNRKYELRKVKLAYAEKNTVVDFSVILFQTILSTAAVSLLFINQDYKSLKLNRKNFGILSSFGMQRSKLFFYIFTRSLFKQILIFVLSYFVMYALFLYHASPETGHVFNDFVMRHSYVPLVIGAFVSSAASGYFAIHMVSKTKMLEALSAQ